MRLIKISLALACPDQLAPTRADIVEAIDRELTDGVEILIVTEAVQEDIALPDPREEADEADPYDEWQTKAMQVMNERGLKAIDAWEEQANDTRE
jgi:hypothetical protein